MVESAAGIYRLNINTHASAQPLSSALHVRRYTLQAERRDASRAAILLSSGEGAIGGAGASIALLAPCMVWLPIQPGQYLRVAAGSSGDLLTLSDMLVRDAVGQGVESIHLRALNERTVVVNAIAQSAVLGEVAQSFAAIAREARLGERGSWSFLTAHVALILVHGWRLSGLEAATRQGFDSHSALLVKFRHLVETHFRERWKIADYADALAVSHDRLHDTCVRVLQRTPLDLLHDRLTHEASLRLARSGLSVEALADDLGFSSPSHLSRFFKQRTGFTPAGYRKAARDASKESQKLPPLTYADWP